MVVYGKLELMTALSKKDLKHLYHTKKHSVREISEITGVSMNSLYRLMRCYDLPRRNFFEANHIRFQKKPLSFSLKKRLNERERQLKLAGTMLYWAEGAKGNEKNGNCTVDLANSNPSMVKLFLSFLRDICGIDEKRLRCFLYCHANQDIDGVKKYWSSITNIPLGQFTKPYIRKDFLPEKSGKMEYGLAHIRYSDKKLLLQIKKWINEYLEKESIG